MNLLIDTRHGKAGRPNRNCKDNFEISLLFFILLYTCQHTCPWHLPHRRCQDVMAELLSLSAIWKDVMMIDLCRRRCAIYLLSSDLTVVWLPAALPGPDWPSHTVKSPQKVIRFNFISPGTQNLRHQSQWSFSFIKLVSQISHMCKTTIYMELNLSWWKCIHFLFFCMRIIVRRRATLNHIIVQFCGFFLRKETTHLLSH